MKNLILLVLAAFLVSCCTNSNEPLLRISGKVLQEGDDTLIEGVELTFYSFIPSSDIGVPGFDMEIGTDISDSNGEYSFSYNTEFQEITLAATKEDYFNCDNHQACSLSISSEGGFTRNIFLNAKATLAFKFVDLQPTTNSNFIVLSPGYPNNVAKSYTISTDSTVFGTIMSNKEHKYSTTLNNNYNLDSIVVSPLLSDTIILEF